MFTPVTYSNVSQAVAALSKPGLVQASEFIHFLLASSRKFGCLWFRFDLLSHRCMAVATNHLDSAASIKLTSESHAELPQNPHPKLRIHTRSAPNFRTLLYAQ